MWKWARGLSVYVRQCMMSFSCAQDWINCDTEIGHMCVLGRHDCQSNPCCLSLLWQETNYPSDHRLRPNHDIYLDRIIIPTKLPPQQCTLKEQGTWEEREEGEVREEGGGMWAEIRVEGPPRFLPCRALVSFDPKGPFQSLQSSLLKQIGPANMWVQSPPALP